MHRAFLTSLSILLISCHVLAQDEEIAKYQPPRDYGHDWSFAPLLNYTPDDGLLIGGGPRLYEFGFRRFPYVYKMDLVGGVTFKTGAYQFAYLGLFPSLLRKVDLTIIAHASQLEVRNFYGYGNNSARDEGLEKSDFYRVNSTEYQFRPSVMYHPHKAVALGISSVVNHFQVRQKPNRYLNDKNIDSIGNDRTILGAGVSIEIDSRNHSLYPTTGVLMFVEAWNFPDPFTDGRPFQKIRGEMRLFFGDTLGRDFVLGFRFKGEKVQGPYPFYEAAFLGGGQSLRGFRVQRFGGDASLLGSVDLRVSLFRMTILVPTEIGLLALADAGRIWFNSVSPGGWHKDYGGGLWFAPISRELVLSVSAASSTDGVLVNGGFGFAF
jgi:hypothetical protein